MPKSQQVIGAIVQQGLLPLYFNQDANKSLAILRSLYSAGIKVVEYTNRGEAAFENFKHLVSVRNLEMNDLIIGVGTIKNMQQALDFLEAGADFLVSPGFLPDVASYCVSKDIMFGPGCMTPTEIIAAENAGIKFIKLFPGDLLGVGFLKGIKEIFPQLVFMPTGGVDATEESIASWFEAGASAVGMGGKLVSKALMEAGDTKAIEEKAREVLKLIQKIKSIN
jgi:2-dehydro-3-deoxyphosphogluconate aldolase / (4S)-4-hydroxy-2-oxoglutarate aldolase